MNCQSGEPSCATLACSSAKLSVPSGVMRYDEILSPPRVVPGRVVLPEGAQRVRSTATETVAPRLSAASTSASVDKGDAAHACASPRPAMIESASKVVFDFDMDFLSG